MSLTSPDMYEDESSLRVHLYMDTDWAKWQKLQLCAEKIALARQALTTTFEFVRFPNSNGGDGKNKEEWRASILSPMHSEAESRPHYWYMVVDDCSLEQYNHDNRIPIIHFEVQVFNDIGGNHQGRSPGSANGVAKRIKLTQLSADEINQTNLHTATLVVSSLITLLMLMYISKTLMDTKAVHAANFLVMAASAFDAASSLCELIHLSWYERNGYGWYFLDAMASHFEAMCDSLVSILLLSIASGWTLPTDVVAFPQNASFVQTLIGGLRNPAGSVVVMSSAGWLAMSIIALHAILAQWGRTYNDDFDSYHDLEHLPGKLLMSFRMMLGLIFIAATKQTSNACPASLRAFYTRFAMVGTLWFQSLPVVTWVCGMLVPYYLRHPVVSALGAMLQTISLLLLASLVSSNAKQSAYQKLSHLQQHEDSLTDQLTSSFTNGGSTSKANPTVWKFGKSKIRLD